jgi:outer membrane protein assembly factor BamB
VQQGIDSASLVWEWDQATRPTALAATSSRLAVITADGRFAWVNLQTGKAEIISYLWEGLLQGDSTGEIESDGLLAVVSVKQTSISTRTGLTESRARLAVYDSSGNQLWGLPEMTRQQYYSGTLASGPGLVIAGRWPVGTEATYLAAYELFTGQRLWRTSERNTGYRQLVHDGTRLFALLTDPNGGGVAAYDLRTGESLWRWSDAAVQEPVKIVLADGVIYALSQGAIAALDAVTGQIKWIAGFEAAKEAGLAVKGEGVFLSPAPSAQTGFRPGVVSLDTATGAKLRWLSLAGLNADQVATGEEYLWAVIKDYDNGVVYLSALEPDTGLERKRLQISLTPETLYQLVALDKRIYVLGDSLLAYGY